MIVDEVQATARDWLSVADEVGWGVEGPAGADEVAEVVRAIADGRDAEVGPALDEDRDLGLRPVDALFEAARLLAEASLTGGPTRTDELVGAARGWLRIASGR